MHACMHACTMHLPVAAPATSAAGCVTADDARRAPVPIDTAIAASETAGAATYAATYATGEAAISATYAAAVLHTFGFTRATTRSCRERAPLHAWCEGRRGERRRCEGCRRHRRRVGGRRAQPKERAGRLGFVKEGAGRLGFVARARRRALGFGARFRQRGERGRVRGARHDLAGVRQAGVRQAARRRPICRAIRRASAE